MADNTVISEFIDGRKLRVSWHDRILFEYNYDPDTKRELCPRPYFHPIHTLNGDVITNNRPADHPWHQGLSLTMTSLNGMNFWGGPTYRAKTGKYEYLDNVGIQRHRDWVRDEVHANGRSWTESVDWIGPNEETVFTEKRTLSVRDIDPELGIWRLVWESELTNVLGHKIIHNSYCSGEGLQDSGYTGLFLRLSRGFDRIGAHIFHPGKPPEWDDYHDGQTVIESPDQLNGWQSTRLAYHGIFDTSLNGGLLLLEDLTENPPYSLHWFCRPEFPCISWSTAYHEPHVIESGETFRLRHSLGIVNGFWTRKKSSGLWLGIKRNPAESRSQMGTH